MSNKSGISSQVISLPKGGGALQGIGEKFAPDLHTGTGNFTIPIALPAGRNGFQPQLSLVYSTGNGNGPFGLSWNVGIPGVSRQTNKGVPKYDDEKDIFVLSGTEDLVPVEKQASLIRYRPRTEGLFALIHHHHDALNDYWEVATKDGLVSWYGTPGKKGDDPGAIADPLNRNKVFAWKLTRTTDPFGNRIEYHYERDVQQTDGPHHWDQLYLSEIRYIDYGDQDNPDFLVAVRFNYEDRPDPFSAYKAGFEIRTVKRCKNIQVFTKPGIETLTRTYHFTYLDQTGLSATQLPFNNVSLLSKVQVEGHDEEASEKLPPLTFNYSRFEPVKRNFFPVTGPDLPAGSLARPEYELADLFGDGLPDILEMNGTVRYWRNLGNGTFDRPRLMRDAPAGLQLADPGIQLIDADGEGRIDLLVTTAGMSGYFPLRFEGEWDRRSFRKYDQAPSFNLEDPEVKLVDLTGDGVTDAIRSGSRMECYFNDPYQGWNETRWVERQSIDKFPNINFSDNRIKWGDLSGDGLQDIIMVHDGHLAYWPNLGYGNWGKQINMHNSPRFEYGYDPKRILVGDIDGDGLDDIVYVDSNKVILWINQSGNGFSDPIEITGTPPVSDMDAVRLVDLLGTGISGILWSADAGGVSRHSMFFLDCSGGVKPYLLTEMDNHMGAVTRVGYTSSINYYLEDAKKPATRWKTFLPFPVQVVAKVEVIDHFSKGKLTTTYHYHHGYWDGAEREFRGFGRVDQRDTETFEQYNSIGLLTEHPFEKVATRFSPPMETRTWFHQGPVGDEFGDWKEVDYSDEYWPGDPQVLIRPSSMQQFLQSLGRRKKRDALRVLRGSVLRTELYAIDGSELQGRPYTVTESQFGVREEAVPEEGETARLAIFFPFVLAQRTTKWERGNEPMHRFAFMGAYDAFGQLLLQAAIAVPRNRDFRVEVPVSNETYLGTCSETTYIKRENNQPYIVDRVARTTSYEILNDGRSSIFQLWEKVQTDLSARKIIGQTLNFYDGEAFVGLPFQKIGLYGALVKTESLVLTPEILQEAWQGNGVEIPPYLKPGVAPDWTADYPNDFRALPPLAGYVFHNNAPYSTGYFVIGERLRYDFHGNAMEIHGLATIQRDSLGRDTAIIYDEPEHPYQLLPVKVTDPAGLMIQALYNYRVLQPRTVIDINNNQSVFHFNSLGLLQSSYVKGKGNEGDQQQAGIRLEYGFLAFENSPAHNKQPVFVRSIRRMHHDTETDIPLPQRDEINTSVEYSDGFGRLLQTRTQAEEMIFGDPVFGGNILPIDQTDTVGTQRNIPGIQNNNPADPNVLVSGWQRYDNKGQVIEKYEPFFSLGWSFKPATDTEKGQKAIMQYDPRGQIVRTINADGSENRVLYGIPVSLGDPDRFTPTPWEAYTYDANDNAVRTHAGDAAIQQYQHHWNTPAHIVIDALGRTIKTVSRHKATAVDAPEEFVTTSVYDIHGNVLAITDALQRVALRKVYDLANQCMRITSLDAGIRRFIVDAIGNPIELRDSKGALILYGYDIMNRPVQLWARDSTGAPITLRQQLVYGDSTASRLTSTQQQALNVRGKLYRHHDEAGLITFNKYDFKGNLLERSRRVIKDEQLLTVFTNAASIDWRIPSWQVNWQPADGNNVQALADTLLEADAYVTTTSYDALNRIKKVQYPQSVDGQRKVLQPHYNRGGALEKVTLDNTAFVERIVYNAKGQRVLVAYGNGIMTRYVYDPKLFRLARMRSERYRMTDPLTFQPEAAPLQDIAYAYDLVGNIIGIKDRTPGSGIPNTIEGINALDRVFTYDSLYRLRSATGREGDQPPDFFWDDIPRSTDLTKTKNYTEQYRYDAADNIENIKHTGDNHSFTRHFQLAPSNNRLQQLTIGQTTFSYVYDANGNMISETSSRHFEWNYANQLRVFRNQTGAAEPSVYAHYLYDATGQRTKKLVRKQGGRVEVTVYIDGMFEHQRIVQSEAEQENNTLHVMDNQSRIALVRVGNPFPDDVTPPVKYHLGDHLSSSNVVIDDLGNLINREEYTSYGETSFGSFAKKRYRFTGQERDNESGLYYQSARYYVPGLARWICCDPLGAVDGLNLYTYVHNSPLLLIDPNGTDSQDNETGRGVENLVCIRDEQVNGQKILQFTNPEDLSDEGIDDTTFTLPKPANGAASTQNNITTEKIGAGLNSTPLGVDPSPNPRKANADMNRNGFKEGSAKWTFFDDLATAGAILGNEWDPDKKNPGAQSGGIAGGKGNKPNSLAQVIYFSIQLIATIGPGRFKIIGQGARAAGRTATAALLKLIKKPPAVKYSWGGEFMLFNWKGYPKNRPQPKGTLNYIDDAKYQPNRKLANDENARIKEAAKLNTVWSEVHEIKPVRFGGDPIDPGNKEVLSPPEHWEVSAFWRDVQRWITGK
jgi:RHS repeat-associated protein